jgi:hypothetical protein
MPIPGCQSLMLPGRGHVPRAQRLKSAAVNSAVYVQPVGQRLAAVACEQARGGIVISLNKEPESGILSILKRPQRLGAKPEASSLVFLVFRRYSTVFYVSATDAVGTVSRRLRQVLTL